MDYELEANGNICYIYYFSFAGLFILIIAIINFINLITVHSFSRAKEIGIIKCVGGNKKQLIWQFLSESTLISFLSLLVSIIMVMLILPYFNNLLGISFSYNDFIKLSILLAVALIWLFSGVGAGMYPAFVLSSFKPIAALKGEVNRGLNKNKFVKSLVIFQFAITSILIFATFMVQKQVNFLQNKKMNFEPEQTLVVQAKTAHNAGSIATMKEEMLKNPAISMATFSFTHRGMEASMDNAFF